MRDLKSDKQKAEDKYIAESLPGLFIEILNARTLRELRYISEWGSLSKFASNVENGDWMRVTSVLYTNQMKKLVLKPEKDNE